ncbi:MAG: methionine aminopeptidase [Aquiluna sp.]|nr:methionine aminopeptidase [Aquiluna sp.]MDP5025870.1 methionine aminopeptidase [Aquiluna sp.]
MEPSREYWFNTKTNKVEVGPQSLSLDRIGPFSSETEAARALEVIAERARRIKEESEREDSWD